MKKQIKLKMIEFIKNHIKDELENTNILDEYIDNDDIYKFIWSKDFGDEFLEEFIENNKTDLINDRLQEIYNEIDQSDLYNPF